jgi:hypothetical protein
VRICKFGRLPSNGWRYDTEAEDRVPSSRALIWNQFAPRTTVLPVLNAVVGMPASAQAASHARPHGSAGGTVRIVTGPELPCWSPGASFDSRRRYSRRHSAALQPVQPSPDQSLRSSSGAMKAMHASNEEHPPSTLARACRTRLLPLICGSTG